jgi:hypothetical protein
MVRRGTLMTIVQNKTDHQIQLLGFEALQKELGIVGFIRFMQQFDSGNGDYVNDRQKWQQHYNVDTLAEAIKTSATKKTNPYQKMTLKKSKSV